MSYFVDGVAEAVDENCFIEKMFFFSLSKFYVIRCALSNISLSLCVSAYLHYLQAMTEFLEFASTENGSCCMPLQKRTWPPQSERQTRRNDRA